MEDALSSTVAANPIDRALARIEAAAQRIDKAARIPAVSNQNQDIALRQEARAVLTQLDELIAELDR